MTRGFALISIAFLLLLPAAAQANPEPKQSPVSRPLSSIFAGFDTATMGGYGQVTAGWVWGTHSEYEYSFDELDLWRLSASAIGASNGSHHELRVAVTGGRQFFSLFGGYFEGGPVVRLATEDNADIAAGPQLTIAGTLYPVAVVLSVWLYAPDFEAGGITVGVGVHNLRFDHW